MPVYDHFAGTELDLEKWQWVPGTPPGSKILENSYIKITMPPGGGASIHSIKTDFKKGNFAVRGINKDGGTNPDIVDDVFVFRIDNAYGECIIIKHRASKISFGGYIGGQWLTEQVIYSSAVIGTEYILGLRVEEDMVYGQVYDVTGAPLGVEKNAVATFQNGHKTSIGGSVSGATATRNLWVDYFSVPEEYVPPQPAIGISCSIGIQWGLWVWSVPQQKWRKGGSLVT